MTETIIEVYRRPVKTPEQAAFEAECAVDKRGAIKRRLTARAVDEWAKRSEGSNKPVMCPYDEEDYHAIAVIDQAGKGYFADGAADNVVMNKFYAMWRAVGYDLSDPVAAAIDAAWPQDTPERRIAERLLELQREVEESGEFFRNIRYQFR